MIDLTADTVTAETLLDGYTAHRADGEQITGTYTPSPAPVDLTNLVWSARATTYTEAEIGKKYLILVPANTATASYFSPVGFTEIWHISVKAGGNQYAHLYYGEATSTTIRVHNPSESSYRYERVALVE